MPWEARFRPCLNLLADPRGAPGPGPPAPSISAALVCRARAQADASQKRWAPWAAPAIVVGLWLRAAESSHFQTLALFRELC